LLFIAKKEVVMQKMYFMEAGATLALLMVLCCGVYFVSTFKNGIRETRISIRDIERKIVVAERVEKELEVKRSVLYGSKVTKIMADSYLSSMHFTRSDQLMTMESTI
jgi:hypothetical protein